MGESCAKSELAPGLHSLVEQVGSLKNRPVLLPLNQGNSVYLDWDRNRSVTSFCNIINGPHFIFLRYNIIHLRSPLKNNHRGSCFKKGRHFLWPFTIRWIKDKCTVLVQLPAMYRVTGVVFQSAYLAQRSFLTKTTNIEKKFYIRLHSKEQCPQKCDFCS